MLSSKFVVWDEVELLFLTKYQYTMKLNEKSDLVFRTDNVHLFNKNRHDLTKLRLRAGLAKGKNQIVLASDVKFFDNNFEMETSWGVFYKRDF
ncbi:MAG: hypothetical protein KAJ23_09660 [Maribacter sp.]|nr:hypothetical protein [Maribacter sp.]